MGDIDWLIESAISYGLKAVMSLAIVIGGFWLISKLQNLISKNLEKRELDISIINFVSSIVGMLLKIMILLAAISTAGVEVTSFLAILGGAALGLGMGLQGGLSNFASGVLILLVKPFKTGDLIKADGHMGYVERIDLLNTSIIPPSHETIIIPNADIFSSPIFNYSIKGIVRIDIVVGISYDDDFESLRPLMKQAITEDDIFTRKSSSVVEIENFGDSSINIAIKAYARTQNYWNAEFKLNEIARRVINENGFTIPFPQRDLHLIKQDTES